MPQVSFAATAATIVSGAVAQRTKSLAYVAFSGIMCALIYPVVAHWMWSDGGWLSPRNPSAVVQAVDFAGGAVVHLVGALAGLVGAVFVGPRYKCVYIYYILYTCGPQVGLPQA